jgi:hypothetical protein
MPAVREQLSPDVVDELRRRIERDGLTATHRSLRVGRSTLLGALSGLGVSRPVVTHLQVQLAAPQAAPSP